MKRILCSLLALVMCISMAATVLAAEMKFTDVKKSDWFYDDVKTAVESGLVNGKSATTYAPNDNLTYAEAIKLAACMNQLYNEGAISLASGNPWYKPYVDYCIDEEIIDKEYNYTENATRAGYMGIFAKALPDEGLEAINNVPDNSIPDVPSSRAYAAGVYKLYRAGILTGVDEAHNCNPLANIKRSEVAAILTRMMNEDKRVEFNMGNEEQKPEEKEPEVKEPEEKEPEEKEPEAKEPETTEPLAIKTQPALTTAVKINEAAKLTVEVEGGKAPYTYQWQVGRAVGKQKTFGNLSDRDTVSGATTEELSLTANAANQSEFRCVITDANGDSITSRVVIVKFEESAETTTDNTESSSGGAKDKFEQGNSEELKKEDFLMYVEDVFTITGRGVIATGRVVNGILKTGDSIQVVSEDGSMMEATVAGIEMFNKMLDEAKKGDNIGLLFDSEVTKDDVSRGDSLIAENSSYDVYEEMIGTLSLTSKEEGGRTTAISEGFEASFYRSGHDFPAKITGLNDGTMEPGQTQDKVTVTTNYFRGVFYVGQVLEVRQAGRKIGTFTIDAFPSGGREFTPIGKSRYNGEIIK